MLVNFERRICYLSSPKTASQTTALALRKFSGFEAVTDHHHPWDAYYGSRDVVEMGMDAGARAWWGGMDPAEFVYFAVIRNPFDTLASWFQLSKAEIRFDSIGPEWFEAFKARHARHFPPEGLFLYPYREPPGPLALLRYESLDVELYTFSEFFRFPNPGKLPIVGATRGKNPDFRTYYTDESRAWVEEHFATDLKAGGYTFE